MDNQVEEDEEEASKTLTKKMQNNNEVELINEEDAPAKETPVLGDASLTPPPSSSSLSSSPVSLTPAALRTEDRLELKKARTVGILRIKHEELGSASETEPEGSDATVSDEDYFGDDEWCNLRSTGGTNQWTRLTEADRQQLHIQHMQEVAKLDPTKRQQLTCSKCNQVFLKPLLIQRHLQFHESKYNPERLFICDFEDCGKKFGCKWQMVEHLVDRHLIPLDSYKEHHVEKASHKIDQLQDGPSPSTQMMLSKLKRKRTCHVCNTDYKSMRLLKCHYKHYHSRGRQEFYCEVECGFVCTTMEDLMEHLEEVHNDTNTSTLHGDKQDEGSNFGNPSQGAASASTLIVNNDDSATKDFNPGSLTRCTNEVEDKRVKFTDLYLMNPEKIKPAYLSFEPSPGHQISSLSPSPSSSSSSPTLSPLPSPSQSPSKLSTLSERSLPSKLTV